MLFAKVVSKFKDCGVSFLDSPIIPAALAYLGLNPDSKKTKDLKKAEQVIAKVALTFAPLIHHNTWQKKRFGR